MAADYPSGLYLDSMLVRAPQLILFLIPAEFVFWPFCMYMYVSNVMFDEMCGISIQDENRPCACVGCFM